MTDREAHQRLSSADRVAIALIGSDSLRSDSDQGASRGRYTPLFRRVFATNAVILTAVAVVTVLVFSPGAISTSVAVKELVILAAALAVMLVVNFALMRRATAPLEQLIGLMRRVDPMRPGQRVEVPGGASEAAELAHTFNEMLQRLESERGESTRAAIAAQEAERMRVARELHDEIGQGLTAGILQLGRIKRQAPAELEGALTEAQDTVRSNLDELRRIAQRLRPGALDELGLASAVTSFSERIGNQAGLRVRRDVAHALPTLTYEEELVLYRVAQEALTNVVRHADATSVELSLVYAPDERRLSLAVVDDGRGFDAPTPAGAGIRGMYERALMIDAEFFVGPAPGGGTEVRLDLPVEPIEP